MFDKRGKIYYFFISAYNAPFKGVFLLKIRTREIYMVSRL